MKGYSLQGMPDSYAKVALGASSAQRGCMPMQTNTQAPIGSQAAVDPFSNPSFGGQQALRESQQKNQATQQSALTSGMQNQAAMGRKMNRAMTDEANRMNMAQTMRSNYEAELIEQMGGSQVLMRAAQIDPQAIAMGKVQSIPGNNAPGLGGIVSRDILMQKGLM